MEHPKLFPDVLATVPIMCSITPFSGRARCPLQLRSSPCGVTLTFHKLSMATEFDISMSKLTIIGVLPSVIGELKETLAVLGLATVFCIIVWVVGSMKVTTVDDMVMLAAV